MHFRSIFLLFCFFATTSSFAQTQGYFGQIVYALDTHWPDYQPVLPLGRVPSSIEGFMILVEVIDAPDDVLIHYQWSYQDSGPSGQTFSGFRPEMRTENRFRVPIHIGNPAGLIPSGTIELYVWFEDGNQMVELEHSLSVGNIWNIYLVRIGTACSDYTGELIGESDVFPSGTQHLAVMYYFTNYAPDPNFYRVDRRLYRADDFRAMNSLFREEGRDCTSYYQESGFPDGVYYFPSIDNPHEFRIGDE